MLIYGVFRRELENIKGKGLFREIRDRSSGQGRVITINDKEYVNFSSNNYLGLASEVDIFSKAPGAGGGPFFGAGASRLLSGGTILHRNLEGKIAGFKGTESALLFNSGYAANTGAIPVLAGEGDALVSDELNHASLIDGCRLSKAGRYIYSHRNVSQLAEILRGLDAKRKVVITDSIFSMDGDIAPLEEIYNLCKEEGAILYVDDAHGTGVIGGGRGALHHFGLEVSDFVIQMGTLSKAIGVFGGFIAADKDTVDYLVNSARSLIFSTALPGIVVSAADMALQTIIDDTSRIGRLWENVDTAIRGLKEVRADTGDSTTQIIPIKFDSLRKAAGLHEYLLGLGIYVPLIRPPAVRMPRLRMSVTAMHTEDDLQALITSVGEYIGRA